MKTEYLYEGYHDPSQKITGDSYRALYGMGVNYFGRGKNPKRVIQIKEPTIKTVYDRIYRHVLEFGEKPLKHAIIAEELGLSKGTIQVCIRVLREREILETFWKPHSRNKGLSYRLIGEYYGDELRA